MKRKRHQIKITPIPKSEGDGWDASIPELGKYAYCGTGRTPREALASLMRVKKDLEENN